MPYLTTHKKRLTQVVDLVDFIGFTARFLPANLEQFLKPFPSYVVEI
jgi:hypothetical protein